MKKLRNLKISKSKFKGTFSTTTHSNLYDLQTAMNNRCKEKGLKPIITLYSSVVSDIPTILYHDDEETTSDLKTRLNSGREFAKVKMRRDDAFDLHSLFCPSDGVDFEYPALRTEIVKPEVQLWGRHALSQTSTAPQTSSCCPCLNMCGRKCPCRMKNRQCWLHSCENRKLQQDFPITFIGHTLSPVFRLGVFAGEFIPKGSFVLSFSGKYSTSTNSNCYIKVKEVQGYDKVFKEDVEAVLDGYPRGNIGAFVNDAGKDEHVNVRFEFLVQPGGKIVCVARAITNIEENDAILTRYNRDFFKHGELKVYHLHCALNRADLKLVSGGKPSNIIYPFGTEEDFQREEYVLQDQPFDKLLRYHGFDISVDDVKTILGKKFYNDTMMDFDRLTIQHEVMTPEMRSRCLLKTPFFMSSVRKRTGHTHLKTTDIFKYDVLIMQVNKDLHWYLYVVNLVEPMLLVMDSLVSDRSAYEADAKLVRNMLNVEWALKFKNGNTEIFNIISMPLIICNVQQQSDGWNCGPMCNNYLRCALSTPGTLDLLYNKDYVTPNQANLVLWPHAVGHQLREDVYNRIVYLMERDNPKKLKLLPKFN